jgi:hypothetical protein
VFQIANEPACARATERQRIPPKVPLEGSHGERRHATEDHAESRLSTCETGVEKSNAGDHEKHHARADYDESTVTRLVPLIEVRCCCGMLLVVERPQRP